jgi:16S rRNA (guanine527-N7)-methyltransferase
VGKKTASVNGVLRSVGVSQQLMAVTSRAEDYARSNSREFAVVTTRAVSALPALVELAAPLLIEGGRLVALKAVPEESELERGRRVASRVGMHEVSVRRLLLPGGTERRCLVSYERSGDSEVRLPRRTGEAQRSPLA